MIKISGLKTYQFRLCCIQDVTDTLAQNVKTHTEYTYTQNQNKYNRFCSYKVAHSYISVVVFMFTTSNLTVRKF